MKHFMEGESVQVVEDDGRVTCTDVIKAAKGGVVVVRGLSCNRTVVADRVFALDDSKGLLKYLMREKTNCVKKISELNLNIELAKVM